MKTTRLNKRCGFTLVEVLIALAITGLIGGAIATSIVQMFDVNHQNTNSITAQRQVQQVGYNMSRDGQNAQEIYYESADLSSYYGSYPNAIAVFAWTDWNGAEIEIVYSLAGGALEREQIGSTSLNIATNLASVVLVQQNDGSGPIPGFYALTVTSTITGKVPVSETRVYEIRQRTVS
jgi:prepilin-type N-terminal cleavage/methylation domain-containing protein